ncbi:transcription factor-like protein [Rhynchospora pubera]|uniref:Transcription factor-like protein n=1 Tax=Rhynchospora pubera TaxID=906938 RepID=A0AAV8HVK0_9POAL|nr:transcription factor-like protein [Rhynchospora pubera]KAJ4821584.1 transcription factor-like protein [Rhynchospora pubera]
METDSEADDFFQRWFNHLYQIRRDLRTARYSLGDRQKVQSAVDQSIAHYESYYRVRSEISQFDPVRAFTTPWATSVERGVVFWLAGWRPNTLVHLLYSESSRRFESQLQDLLSGTGSGDLGDLSPTQLKLVDELQRRTIQEEDELELEMSRLHEDLATRFIETGSAELGDAPGRIKDIIARADDLRMRTLHAALKVLCRPIQAVDLLIAAADFEIGIRNFGLKHENEMGGT